MPSPFGVEQDTFFMKEAFAQAQEAFEADEVPIGAIVVNAQGAIIGRGYNQVERRHSQAAHAEMLALDQACQQNKDWRLIGCWVYVTVQPCGMCMAYIQLSRCQGVIYGVESPLFGYHLVDNDAIHSLYKKDIIHIESGLYAAYIAELMKKFFTQKRHNHDT